MISDEEFLRIVSFVKSRYGIDLHGKKAIINGRLENYLRRGGWGSFSAFMNDVEKDRSGDLEKTLMNYLTTNHTYFMREFGHFDFFKKEVLTYRTTVSSLDSYQDAVAEMGETSEWVGYPTGNGILYNEMISITPLGINHASEAKEGAWAFLEFLLSENYQGRKTGFPVRQDSFEKYLEQTQMFNGVVQIELTEKDKEVLQSIIDHAYWMQAHAPYEVFHIIYEEAGAVFAGDKTSEEAAEIIQRRVQLYIQE